MGGFGKRSWQGEGQFSPDGDDTPPATVDPATRQEPSTERTAHRRQATQTVRDAWNPRMDPEKFAFYIDLAKLRVRARIGAWVVRDEDWHPALERELAGLGVQHTDILRKSRLLDRAA